MSRKRTRFVAVGACAIDNILDVPYFPEEDSKLRATSMRKRRGGNCPNSLEVLQQLISRDLGHEEPNGDRTGKATSSADSAELELLLIATLPSRKSEQLAFIKSSFDRSLSMDSGASSKPQNRPMLPKIDFSHCIYREDHTEPVSSYIISSQSNSSRTIINHNALPEMTFGEFVSLTHDLLQSQSGSTPGAVEQVWFHFEGRIPQITLQCIRYLRNHRSINAGFAVDPRKLRLSVSVEVEKPGREGLQELAQEADVVFYSRSWAGAEGYDSAETCLNDQSRLILCNPSTTKHGERMLICPWGAKGACATKLPEASGSHDPTKEASTLESTECSVVHSPAYISETKRIIDTTGLWYAFKPKKIAR